MDKAVLAMDYLANPRKFSLGKVIIVFGDEPFLVSETVRQVRQQILGDQNVEFSFTLFEGNSVLFRTVLEEVSTLSLFNPSGFRVVEVDDADVWITRNRDDFERYLDKPAPQGILLLRMASCAANTLVYKKTLKQGLILDCRVLASKDIPSWVISWAKKKHKLTLSRPIAALFVDLIGNELGLLDMELSRLALMLSPDEKITESKVRENVGSWRTQRVWDMLDAALAGELPKALKFLNSLLASGENPIGILAQISANLRRLASATRLFLASEQSGRRPSLRDAMLKVGIKEFALSKTEEQMKKLGRFRGALLLNWLLDADLDMKGGSRSNPRLILEQLLIKISSQRLRAASSLSKLK